MKRFMQIALGALMLGGLTAGTAVPASARVAVGIGIGVPAYPAYPYYYGHSCRWYYVRGLAAPAGCYGYGYYGYGYAPVGLSFTYHPGWHRVWYRGRWAWRHPHHWRHR